jgi:hypothetical protein
VFLVFAIFCKGQLVIKKLHKITESSSTKLYLAFALSLYGPLLTAIRSFVFSKLKHIFSYMIDLIKMCTKLNHIAGNPFIDDRRIDDDTTQEIASPKDFHRAAKYVTIHCWPGATGLC